MPKWINTAEFDDVRRIRFHGSVISFVRNARKYLSKHPFVLVYDNGIEIGALWQKTTRRGDLYLSGKIAGRVVTVFFDFSFEDGSGVVNEPADQVHRNNAGWKAPEPEEDQVFGQRPKWESRNWESINPEPFASAPSWATVLGVSPQATMEEIKRAWRRLALENHPDHGGRSEDFIRIRAAFEAAVEARK